jgi:DNA-binding transcriptional MerR regulator
MRIGELSRKTGVSVRMLRYYEAEGLLSPGRSERGHRIYGRAEADVVERIQTLGRAGMTLAVIKNFLPCSLDQPGEFEPCHELRSTLLQHIDMVDSGARKLADIRERLTKILERFAPHLN